MHYNNDVYQRLIQLADKIRWGKATDEEIGEFDQWFESADSGQMENYTDGISEDDKAMVRDRHLERVLSRISDHKKGKHRIYRWLPYAAAAMLAIAIGWLTTAERQQEMAGSNPAGTEELLPGTNQATLTLTDGTTISLDDTRDGISIHDDRIAYAGSSHNIVHLTTEMTSLSVSTPNGGTYQLTLPDGSKVWLNAGSTLRYPAKFNTKERVVELSGEAYLSVVNSSKIPSAEPRDWPFRVLSRGQAIEVLGTEFNVTAYPDEPETKTTLIEGAVQIVNTTTETVSKLQPGEQSTTHGGGTDIRQVDTAVYVAWKKGYFHFSHEPLESIMRKVTRWYDAEVTYADERLRHVKISGSVSRFANASQVMEKIAFVGDLRFDIRERTIHIHK